MNFKVVCCFLLLPSLYRSALSKYATEGNNGNKNKVNRIKIIHLQNKNKIRFSELSPKKQVFTLKQIAALCLSKIQSENLV